MPAVIFTEASPTTTDAPTPCVAREYYGGSFLSVATLSDVLEDEEVPCTLWILDDTGTWIRGDTPIGDDGRPKTRPEGSASDGKAVDRIQTEVGDADVVVVALSTDRWARVQDRWAEIVEAAKPDSIWCLAGARSVLDGLGFHGLEKKGIDVLTYERVGVARIDRGTREELLKRVKARS